MSILNKQAILQVKDMVIEKIDVPEWGGTVCMRSITAAERGIIEAAAAAYKDSKGKNDGFARTFTVKILSMGLCDEDGKRLFSDDEVSQLAAKNAKVVSRLAEVAQKLSGFAKEDLEELERNLAPAQPDASPSA